jgi:hypothetical protein
MAWPDDFFVVVAPRFGGDREILSKDGDPNAGGFALLREE